MKLGLHLSIGDSLDKVIDRATAKGCNTLQMFSRNPRAWITRGLDISRIEQFKVKLRASRISPVFVHAPYLLNLGSPKKDVHHKSVESLKAELRRAGELDIGFVVTHLGSHLGHGKMNGLRRVVKGVEESLSAVKNNVVLLLENNAGTKNSLGSSFEDLQYITSKIRDSSRTGICFDTCHAFVAGYDLVPASAVNQVLRRFDETVGLKTLKLVHLNDSKGSLGSRLDRHEHIGLGKIGEKGFRNILRSELRTRPLILETPIDIRRDDAANLRKVRELAIT